MLIHYWDCLKIWVFFLQWYSFLITQINFIGAGPGKQIAVGTGEFEDIKCGYTQETILNHQVFYL